MKDSTKKINFLPFDFAKKDAAFCYTAYFSTVVWAVLQLITVIVVSVANILSVFNILSILIVLGMSCSAIYFVYRIFILQNGNKHLYNIFRSFVGYGVVLTYVFTSLPRMVGSFAKNISKGFEIFAFVLTVLCFLIALAAYYFVRSGKTRVFIGLFTQNDINHEILLKKDKKLRKEEQKELRKTRNFFQNLWYEWIDVILQAIVIALVIQQFVFQMYQIPSESMVPTFLIGDRVIVNKFVYGAHIPLTDWQLPAVKQPKSGDIVVFTNPDESIQYENAFKRIMHPFIYMLTLSLVDIDKKEDGTPKERFIVKRLIGVPNEKVCVLNDKVYKKTVSRGWVAMADLEGSREYGNCDIYNQNNVKIRSQRMTPRLRQILNNAEYLVNNMDDSEITKLFEIEKNKFLLSIEHKGVSSLRSSLLESMQMQAQNVYSLIDKFTPCEHVVYNLNAPEIRHYFSTEEIAKQISQYETLFDQHYFISLYMSLQNMANFLQKGVTTQFFQDNIKTSFEKDVSDNPYCAFMKKLNLLYKYYNLRIFNDYLQNPNEFMALFQNDSAYKSHSDYRTFADFDYLYVYLYGSSHLSRYCTFELRNFPEYPNGDKYLSDEYFLMGDNRYNSLDSRFGYVDNDIAIDESDTSAFSTKVNVSWEPHTIKKSHLLGKAKAIYFPLDRIGLLK